MLENFKFTYYLNVFMGLLPFYYKIQHNEIVFSFPKILTVYCYSLFTINLIISFCLLYSGCCNNIVDSFLSSVLKLTFYIGWLFWYMNSYYCTKGLIIILENIYVLEKKLHRKQQTNSSFFLVLFSKTCTFYHNYWTKYFTTSLHTMVKF